MDKKDEEVKEVGKLNIIRNKVTKFQLISDVAGSTVYSPKMFMKLSALKSLRTSLEEFEIKGEFSKETKDSIEKQLEDFKDTIEKQVKDFLFKETSKTVTKEIVKDTADKLFSSIGRNLSLGRSVTITGLGKFNVKRHGRFGTRYIKFETSETLSLNEGIEGNKEELEKQKKTIENSIDYEEREKNRKGKKG